MLINYSECDFMVICFFLIALFFQSVSIILNLVLVRHTWEVGSPKDC